MAGMSLKSGQRTRLMARSGMVGELSCGCITGIARRTDDAPVGQTCLSADDKGWPAKAAAPEEHFTVVTCRT